MGTGDGRGHDVVMISRKTRRRCFGNGEAAAMAFQTTCSVISNEG